MGCQIMHLCAEKSCRPLLCGALQKHPFPAGPALPMLCAQEIYYGSGLGKHGQCVCRTCATAPLLVAAAPPLAAPSSCIRMHRFRHSLTDILAWTYWSKPRRCMPRQRMQHRLSRCTCRTASAAGSSEKGRVRPHLEPGADNAPHQRLLGGQQLAARRVPPQPRVGLPRHAQRPQPPALNQAVHLHACRDGCMPQVSGIYAVRRLANII